jgi:demethylmenaquinone methyltransferase / 2-methoxy-6-polyprenyl-1,4-benzoquinol methylase
MAYSYLPASVRSFPPPAQFVAMLERAGFVDVQAIPLTFGIVYLYVGTRAR